jgi:type I restriction enzyme R subunit
MSEIGQREKLTQKRVVRMFQDQLGYVYRGDLTEKEDNRNIETEILRPALRRMGYAEGLIGKAIYILEKASADASKSLYDRNHAVYDLLRYGVKVKPEVGENTETVWLIDWKNPARNEFAIAEEVTVPLTSGRKGNKRPDIVLYVNGIALAVLELKKSTVSVSQGIQQNLGNQKRHFIEHFFTTIQLVMAGNDSEGLRYGCIETQEKYYLQWKEDGPDENLLDRHLAKMCAKARFLEIIHDFIVFDAGRKKLCRHNQYFGVKAAQEHVRRNEGGIIWHTQGSGKSLTMVWLTKWLRENERDARVLIITDRLELDEQIEKVFKGVNEEIYRTKSGDDLIRKLNVPNPWLICSLIHKFGAREDGEEVGDIVGYVDEVKRAVPAGFSAKGRIFVFVDECHRTQSGLLHEAMKAILPGAVFIGFTGTPLLKADKKKSIEIFGGYIHTYKFDEAVKDGVILDLRYEARDIDQQITSQSKVDAWFDSKTSGLSDIARAQLKQRWGTMQKVLSSQDRLEKIVADILMDFELRDRLKSGRGNAILVSGSIYQACKFYELFAKTELAGRCAVVTSYKPSPSDIKSEETGEGLTEKLRQYDIYRKMLSDWFREPEDEAVKRVDEFEKEVKKKFIEEPGQMQLLIVVDKLLTGFDAPSATYLYIDKQMRDHGLFQAICRVNRLDGEDKTYGYIVDYKDLFKSLEGAISDYTSEAFDSFDEADVQGLIANRIAKGKEDLESAREAIKALCEPVETPRDERAFFRYFSSADTDDKARMKETEPRRLALYRLTVNLLRAYAAIANEMKTAGYSEEEIRTVQEEVRYFENIRNIIKIQSSDAVDLKRFEPAMRHLIDTYIRAEDSKEISGFDDMSLIQLIVERGPEAVEALPAGIRKNRDSVAETIENNVRKLIIDEQPINPKYYEKMSELLDALIEQRRRDAFDYKSYLKEIVELTRKIRNPQTGASYPASLETSAKRALFDNLNRDENLALAVDEAVRSNRQDDWRGNAVKIKKIRIAVKNVLSEDETLTDRVMELVKYQNEY